MRSALFLDRDGVVNEEVDFCHRIEDFAFRPGIFDLVGAAHRANRAVVVVTNQSGIARGYFTEEDFQALTRYMKARFEEAGTALTDVLHCPYHPAAVVETYRADHPWRKPRPGMLLEAARRHGLDVSTSVLVGDRMSDIEAAAAAGLAAACLVGSPDAVPRLGGLEIACAPDVVGAASWYAERLAREAAPGGASG